MRAGLREGLLFRSSEALQTAGGIDVVAFDKTGTLSQGSFSVIDSAFLVNGAEHLVEALSASNGHPISKAVLSYLATLRTAPTMSISASGIVSLPGMGVKASVAGYALLGGNARFTGVIDNPVLIAAFGLADLARPESAGLVADLSARGIRVVLLSGDNDGAVARFAKSISLSEEQLRASCSPADKASFIANLQQAGRLVAFVGDGTNDGPALAQADISFSIGTGSDVAIAASGAVIIGSNLRRSVIGALDLASHTRQHTVAALGWCVVYFVFAILLASGAFVKLRIEPQWAGLGELVSILPVIAVGMGLDLRWRWRKAMQ